GYSFSRSPFDFIVLVIVRLCLLVTAAFLIALKETPTIKNFNRPILGISIASVSYSLVKLLVFSESKDLLQYPGLWFVLIWSLISPPLFWALWTKFLSSPSSVYDRLFNPDEGRSDSNGSSIPDNPSSSSKNLRTSTWAHVRRLVSFCLLEWQWFLSSFLCLLSHCLVRIFIPYYTGEVIIVHRSSYKQAYSSVAMVAILTGVSTVLSGFRGGCFDYATSLVAKRVRRDLFASLVKQEIAFFDAHSTGEIVSRLTSDCQSISDSVSLNLTVFSRNAIMMVGALCFMFTLSWRLALLTIVAVPVAMYVTKTYAVLFDKLSEDMQKTIATANQAAEEVLSTMRTVRSFAGEDRERRRYEQMLDQTLTIGKKRAIAHVGSNIVGEFSNNAILVAVLAYGAHLVISERMHAEHFISFMIYQMQLGENLYNMSWALNGMMQSVGASRKVFEYIHRVPMIVNEGELKADVQGEIKIEELTFAYPSRPKNVVLKSLDLSINAGETVALVGLSGGGKSSIVSLIEHFYDPDAGSITLDGLDIREYDHEHFHQKVALVSQEPILYNGTVRSNISYGCDWATDEDIIKASKIANAHDFVVDLEQGYDTPCGEKGAQMSCGQKQRIAIARALIRNPSVLILDEATSALDAESEQAVQTALRAATAGRTVLIIAHRLSTIEAADRIAVINKGRVVQV
ncbi:hypothetical protein PMAYCL1PPCAC_04817, partial [Pristionchus mayeri]